MILRDRDFPGRWLIVFRNREIWFRFPRLSGCLAISRPGKFKLGYDHIYYDGDFYSFGLWFFVITWTTNPRFYFTEQEINENIAFSEKRHNARLRKS